MSEIIFIYHELFRKMCEQLLLNKCHWFNPAEGVHGNIIVRVQTLDFLPSERLHIISS